MPKFLTTTGVSFKLEEIIKSADEKLILISPFLKINERIRELIEDKNRIKINTEVIYGKKEIQPDEDNWLRNLDYVRTGFCKNLHAKCYLNEKEALVTSMNLYEFSQQNNNEMGIYVSKETDPELYDAINDEAKRLFRISEEGKVTVEKVARKEEKKENNKKSKSSDSGYCIRCKKEIKIDPLHPYCKDCFMTWNKYGNEDHAENVCHVCGKETNSSKLKPICYNCYKKYKGKLELPI
ncbi:phospholipase D family protein [Methanohalophilus profundi]|uniref:phospholipase D family protein n=1 Tax=Methanohalophilus profundi TaxID=2138083 RepID=UPI00101C6C84|nr:phospholipase D family protein [Methanohalophilus profundi]